MSVAMVLTSIVAEPHLLADALKALDSLREQAKGSKDAALKENISRLYDNLLDLKAAVIRVEEENSDLRRTIAQQANATGKLPVPEIREVGTTIYYFIGDKGPFCQPCYDRDRKLVALTPPQDY